MDDAQLLIAGLLVSVAVLGGLARQINVPYPIVLVIGGAVFGFIPGMPDITVDPDVVLLVFLPPLLYSAASFSNSGDMRRDTRAITFASIGMVAATAAAVAFAAHETITGLPWGAAVALGAIVAPTDPLAGAEIMRSLRVPRRYVNLVEGEGLFNDATALVLYRVAVVAVVAGSFSAGEAALELVLGIAAGVGIGLIVGYLIGEIRKRISDSEINITVSLLSGYAAYIPAHAIGASGVLAAVTTGLYMGRRVARDLDARTRLRGIYVWEILDFLLNASLFVLIGLQLPSVVHSLSGYATSELITDAAVASAVVILVRIVWVGITPYLIRMIDRRPAQRERRVSARARFVVAWSGMRGAVSLAAALALPLATDAGAPFPERDLLIFITFGVIFSTLVFQGLTLPAVIRWSKIGVDTSADAFDLQARVAATDAALAEVELLSVEEWTNDESVGRLRGIYTYRKRRLGARDGTIESEEDYEDRSLRWQQMTQRVLTAQRQEVVRLRDTGEIPNDVMNAIVRELDLEEARLEI
jgi:CPA1 family monovalent cation:H+ antiporter